MTIECLIIKSHITAGMHSSSVIFESEQKLREHFPNCNLIFKAPREKVLADGVLQAEDNCDIYAICGNQTLTWEAVRLLQEAHGRTGRAFFVSNYFKENIIKARPMSASFVLPTSQNSNSTYVIGSVNVPGNLSHYSTPIQRNRYSVQNELDISSIVDDMQCLKFGQLNSRKLTNPIRPPIDHKLNKCQMYRQSNPTYLRHMVDSSTFFQNSVEGEPILDNLPIPHITVHGNNNAIQLIKPKRLSYDLIDILGRYRSKISRTCPKEWDYLITINPDVFTTQFTQQRVKRYLDYWNIEEY
ncbi:hypothetical protein GJ496_005951 [Pomphorhynchus laevis]|nr:hypothetical protein GJ496_005951 [Pomphorhynchus laevis]